MDHVYLEVWSSTLILGGASSEQCLGDPADGLFVWLADSIGTGKLLDQHNESNLLPTSDTINKLKPPFVIRFDLSVPPCAPPVDLLFRLPPSSAKATP